MLMVGSAATTKVSVILPSLCLTQTPVSGTYKIYYFLRVIQVDKKIYIYFVDDQKAHDRVNHEKFSFEYI
jgi:hypothetical protein